jgi:hypothetical protein
MKNTTKQNSSVKLAVALLYDIQVTILFVNVGCIWTKQESAIPCIGLAE